MANKELNSLKIGTNGLIKHTIVMIKLDLKNPQNPIDNGTTTIQHRSFTNYPNTL